MGLGYDIIVVTDAGQIAEPELHVATVNAMAWSWETEHPLHLVVVGKRKDLPESYGMDLMRRYDIASTFNYYKQAASAWERLRNIKSRS